MYVYEGTFKAKWGDARFVEKNDGPINLKDLTQYVNGLKTARSAPPIVRQKGTQMLGADERCLVTDPGVHQGAITVDERCLVTDPGVHQGAITVDERSLVADPGVHQGAITVDERSLVADPGVHQGATRGVSWPIPECIKEPLQ